MNCVDTHTSLSIQLYIFRLEFRVSKSLSVKYYCFIADTFWSMHFCLLQGMQYSVFTINRKTKSTNCLLLLYLLKLMFHSGVLIPVMLTNVHLKAGLVLELFPTKLTTGTKQRNENRFVPQEIYLTIGPSTCFLDMCRFRSFLFLEVFPH